MDLVIRISLQDKGFVDWNLPPPYSITFQDVLYAISEASNNEVIVSSFEYLDEESDRITVKSDRELHAMVQFHVSQMELLAQSGKPVQLPLIIYPKVLKPAQQRNVHGLKLSLTTTSVKKTNPTQQQLQNHQSTNKENASLKPSLPNKFGDFQFIELLGNGNSGVVYKAVHKRTGTVTAIKSIALDLSDDEQGRIKSELAILSRCNGSPHIVAFYGSYFDDSRIFLCMEYMDVGSLDQFSIIPEHVLRRICHCVLQGLRYMWSLKIMHRDVKPSNMLVNTLGTVKLCDFGVSTQLVNSIAQTYVGTNAYMAPERVVGENYSIYSDVWSLGLSICEMATGNFPYPQLTEKMAGSQGLVPMELMQCIVHDAAPRLSGEKFSADFVDFIQLCLQKVAGHRPTPDTLCKHKFVHMEQIIRDKDEIIAKWVIENRTNKK